LHRDTDTGQISPADTGSIEALAKAHPDLVAELRKLEPLATAATFGGLLAMPELQANCFRLEYLVHLASVYCEGRMDPSQGFVRRSFERLGNGYCGMQEDPAEDIFVALVNTPRGNFRVFEGVREGTGFHLQRILNVLERMPQATPFTRIRDSVESLLKLSDAVAARAGVIENSVGQELPLDALPRNVIRRTSTARALVRFREKDLEQLQIPETYLSEFAFRSNDRLEMRAESLGHTRLERRPVTFHEGTAHLLLPTAVGSAITRFVIEEVVAMGFADDFDRALADDFAELFNDTPILGNRYGAEIRFQRISGGRIAAVMNQVDPGRFLHLVIFVDGVDGFSQGGLGGQNSNPDSLASALSTHLGLAAARARETPGFRGGISLFVAGGFGRAIYFGLEEGLPEHWRLEPIAAHDLVTLSWLSGFDGLSLWRLLDAQEAIEQQGAVLVNVNGILNLVAWARHLHGHLVPHGQLPDEFAAPSSRNPILLPQDMLRDLRRDVARDWNPRRVRDSGGRWVKVRKLDKSEFAEDNSAPLYGSEEDLLKGKLRGVYVASKRPWWVEIATPEDAPTDLVFKHWELLCMWLRRSAPVLDTGYSALPPGPISFCVSFAEVAGGEYGAIETKNEDELRRLLTISTEIGSSRIQINVAKRFDEGLSQPENIAERVLVEALVAGAAQAGGEAADLGKRTHLVNEICPNSQARWMHRFETHHFRDFVRSEVSGKPVLIDELDDASSRIGLGWRVRFRSDGPAVSGVPECTSYLNDIVRVVLDDLCATLKGLDRRSLVRALLQNHETASHDRDAWNRTAQANLALHDDKDATVHTIVEHYGRLNACFTASRTLLEAAICECPLAAGGTPGRLDLSRAMAQAMLAYYFGGSSDAIHWGAMEASLRITPLGDVHMDQSFMESVYQPFGRFVGEADVMQASGSYAELYRPAKAGRSITDVFEGRFLDAWAAEFGVSLVGALTFVEQLEEAGLQPPKAVLELSRSTLAAMLSGAAGVSLETALASLDFITLVPRREWRVVSGEFKKDWYPWRFRRRLSVLRRPLIQIDSGDDPLVALAPALVRDSLLAMVIRFHSGEIPPSQARSLEMRRWIGHANNVQRLEFNSSVADRMRELGWQVEKEIKLTGLLGRPLDRDYGDIDVLAWRTESGRVLVIECKDVQFNKTLGEVAEQLNDFRGEIRPDGRPDHLRRHLNRLEALARYGAVISQKLKLTSPVKMEGHLVFRNPVPMRFAWDQMARRVRLSLFDELDRL